MTHTSSAYACDVRLFLIWDGSKPMDKQPQPAQKHMEPQALIYLTFRNREMHNTRCALCTHIWPCDGRQACNLCHVKQCCGVPNLRARGEVRSKSSTARLTENKLSGTLFNQGPKACSAPTVTIVADMVKPVVKPRGACHDSLRHPAHQCQADPKQCQSARPDLHGSSMFLQDWLEAEGF